MDIKMKIAKRVKELRIKAQMTQSQLSEYSGIDRTFVCHIEAGKRNVSAETMEALFYGLGVTFKVFFSSKYFGK